MFALKVLEDVLQAMQAQGKCLPDPTFIEFELSDQMVANLNARLKERKIERVMGDEYDYHQ